MVSLSYYLYLWFPFPLYSWQRTLVDQDDSLRSAFDAFMRYMFPVYIVSIVYVFAVSIGMLAFLIPGIIVTVLFIAFPFVSVIEGATYIDSIKKAYAFGKSNFKSMLLTFILFALMEWFISMLAVFVTNLFTGSYLMILCVHFLASVFYFPLFNFFITVKYLDWIGGGETDAILSFRS